MYYFLVTDDTQDGDSEHITPTGNGNHKDVVIELSTAFAVFH